jgi:para-aminobenzoate synthetase/4-amino-4-deoxychorismate lyase
MGGGHSRPAFLIDFPLDDRQPGLLAFGNPVATHWTSELAGVGDVLRLGERAARAGAWVVSFVTFESAPAFDVAHQVHPSTPLPFAYCAVFDRPLTQWHAPAQSYSVAPWRPAVSRERFAADIRSIRESIACGDAYQINYTFELSSRFAGDDLAWFLALRESQRPRFSAYLDLGRYRILSLSPELFFRRDGNMLLSKPMKGTAPRHHDPGEDQKLSQWLRSSAKNRAENAMIVDVVRNDLSRIATVGTVNVDALFSVEQYPTVLQMTSSVSACVPAETRLDEIFGALFPCASVTGAPKIKVLSLIARLERRPRGIYCGSIGILRPRGDSIFNVAIRTVLIDSHDGRATCAVGGGITWDSSEDEEYREAIIKSRFLTGCNHDSHVMTGS